MDIKGKCTVFVHEKEFNGTKKKLYSIGLSKKDLEGNWQNAYLPVNFKKGVELPDKSKIEITQGWLDFYKNKDNVPVITGFINQFEYTEKPSDSFATTEDPNLPF